MAHAQEEWQRLATATENGFIGGTRNYDYPHAQHLPAMSKASHM